MHVHSRLHALLLQIGSYVALFLSETDDLAVLASFVGFGGGGHKNSLKNVGLPLRVVPIENIGPLIKLHVEKIIIPIVSQLYRFDDHTHTPRPQSRQPKKYRFFML